MSDNCNQNMSQLARAYKMKPVAVYWTTNNMHTIEYAYT